MPSQEEKDRVAKFLVELAALSKKHGVKVDSCGCCDSPWLKTNETIDPRAFYAITVEDDGLLPEFRDLRLIVAEDGELEADLTQTGKTKGLYLVLVLDGDTDFVCRVESIMGYECEEILLKHVDTDRWFWVENWNTTPIVKADSAYLAGMEILEQKFPEYVKKSGASTL